ncbi:MAG: adenine phosphoribosyltransferase [Candidatus Omnitrophica bacterium]|nr:adenine phosphoribosyltransferase [Candidatus Omnitrophota bacterium]
MVETIKKSELKNYIRDIRDFPKEGILFKDITTLLKDKDAFKKAVDLMAKKYKKAGVDYVVGVEARGFIFGAAVAYKLGVGFVPVRKKGKLPARISAITYDLEYGTDTLEIHEDAIPAKSKVLIVDDLLATGGTIRAVADLLKNLKADTIGAAFLIELRFLKGKKKLQDLNLFSLLKY